MGNKVYLEYDFKLHPLQPASDILIAQLGEVGFESFVENEEGIQAYIQKEDWYGDILATVQILGDPRITVAYELREIEQENWNETWERNFNPIEVDGQCVVRAPFHKSADVPFDIVIEPKMSFGTGHHETTHMMLQFILDTDFEGKSVLDMGSGTGVLAILASMRGADLVTAIDIDNWCYLNAVENVERNGRSNITVLEGDSGLLDGKEYDVVLANINRNVLLGDIPVYGRCLSEKGTLILSGFYTEDIPLISEKCSEVGLKLEKSLEKNNWVAVKYVL